MHPVKQIKKRDERTGQKEGWKGNRGKNYAKRKISRWLLVFITDQYPDQSPSAGLGIVIA